MRPLITLLVLLVTVGIDAAVITNWGTQLPNAAPNSADVMLMQQSGITRYFTTSQLATNLSTNAALVAHYSIVSNANQFGPSSTLTLKDGLNLTNPVINGLLQFRQFSDGSIGFSNITAGTKSLYLTDPSDDFWSIAGKLYVGDTVWANTLSVSNMPGSGSLLAIDSSGNTYKTNANSAISIPSRSVAWSSNSVVVGNNKLQYDPQDFFIEFVGPTVSINNGANTNIMDPIGFGSIGPQGFTIYSSNATPRWNMTASGNWQPVSRDRYDVGDTNKPVRNVVSSNVWDSSNVKYWGAAGDGVTDDTAAIQLTMNRSHTVYFPAGDYLVSDRLTVPTNNFNLYIIRGEGVSSTRLLTAFSGQTTNAVIYANGVFGGGRAFVSVRDLAIARQSGSTNIDGIYINFGGQLSSIRDVAASGLRTGFRIAGSYEFNGIGLNASSCRDGLIVGYQLDGTDGSVNAIHLVGGAFSSNSKIGITLYGVRNSSLTGVTAESNGEANIYLNFCHGTTIDSCYQEAQDVVTCSAAQIRINNSDGVVVSGIDVSNFRSNAPVFLVEASKGISFDGMTIERGYGATAIYQAFGFIISNSVVNVDNSTLNNIATGIVVNAASRVHIRGLSGTYITSRVSTDGNADNFLEWTGYRDPGSTFTQFHAGTNVYNGITVSSNGQSVTIGTNFSTSAFHVRPLFSGQDNVRFDDTNGFPRFRFGVAVAIPQRAALWMGDTTASSANITLFSDGANTFLNGSTDVTIASGGTGRWTANSSGHLVAFTDNAYRIGDTTSGRPTSVHVTSHYSMKGTNTASTLTSGFGAHLWSDGTNLCVVLENSAGGRTTNKLSMTAWP